ncbi:MAG TPA: hypothetical protein V6C76_04945 [Drouetiella sp.]
MYRSALLLAGILQLTCIAANAQGSPTTSYLEIHKKELAATSYADLQALRSSTSIAKDKPMTKDELNFLFPLFKAGLPKQVTITNEKVNGTSAILEATGENEPQAGVTDKTVGQIELTWEDGQWKIEHERWDTKVVMK